MSKRAEEMALKAYPEETRFVRDYNQLAKRQIYQQGYEQGEKDMIERACEWWYQRIAYVFGNSLTKNIAEEFKQAMEEE